MSYRVLPTTFDSRVDPFRSLPAEMVSEIFRYLDDDSLGSVRMTCQRFRKICLYDLKLRRKLDTRRIELMTKKREELLNPKFGGSVVRNCSRPYSLFGSNLQETEKKVIRDSKRKGFVSVSPRLHQSSHSDTPKNKKTNHRSMRI